MLIVHLPHTATQAASGYAYVHSDGQKALRSGAGVAASLPGNAGEVVALVPHTRLAWFPVHLPPGSHGARLMPVLHSLLEDRLLDSPDQSHIVTAPNVSTVARTGGETLVAVCDKQWLRDALVPLQTQNIPVQRIVPEFAPCSPEVLHVINTADKAQHIHCHARGVTRLPPNPAQWPAFGLTVPSSCAIHAEPACVEHSQPLAAQPPVLLSTAQRWIQATHTDWDMAQGEWAQGQARRLQRIWQSAWQTLCHAPAWRPVRWGLVSLVLIQVLALNALAWRERQAVREQQANVQRIMQATFPHVRLVVDAPLQMRRELEARLQTSGSAGSRDFEPMLAALAAALPGQQTPTQIDYTDRALRFQGVQLDAPQAQSALRSRGYRLQQENNGGWLLTEEVTP